VVLFSSMFFSFSFNVNKKFFANEVFYFVLTNGSFGFNVKVYTKF
jgi:hypothetical protein